MTLPAPRFQPGATVWLTRHGEPATIVRRDPGHGLRIVYTATGKWTGRTYCMAEGGMTAAVTNGPRLVVDNTADAPDA